MKTIELSAGTVEYRDTGGRGPTLVLLHGMMMDATLWDGVIAELCADHRCIAPTLPLGAHRRPMDPDADLSLPGVARLVAEFLERLDLRDVTVAGSDTGGALTQLLMRGDGRIGSAVLVSCEAFDNFPARVTGRALVLAGRFPPRLFGLFLRQLRLRAVRRLPVAFGWLTRNGHAATAEWIRPVLSSSEIRRDAVRMLRAAALDRRVLVEAAGHLPRFERPVLVAWAAGDRVMPPEHGRRLRDLLPDGRLVEIPHSRTLLPLDQPSTLAGAIRSFLAEATRSRSR